MDNLNISQRKKVNMYKRVFNYLDTNADKLTQITERTNAFNRFQISLGEILNFERFWIVENSIDANTDKKSLKTILKKQYKGHVNEAFAEIDNNLSLIDTEIKQLKATHADVYTCYKSARKIESEDKLNILKGWVFDASSGQPLEGVTLKFFEDEEILSSENVDTNGKYEKMSASKGAFRIKSIDKGAYFVKAIKMGYKEQTVVLHVNEGEKNEVAIELEKA